MVASSPCRVSGLHDQDMMRMGQWINKFITLLIAFTLGWFAHMWSLRWSAVLQPSTVQEPVAHPTPRSPSAAGPSSVQVLSTTGAYNPDVDKADVRNADASGVDVFLGVLQAGDYRQAYALYRDADLEYGEHGAEKGEAIKAAYYNSVLTFMQALISDKQYPQALLLSEVFLQQAPEDYTLSVLRANVLIDQGELEAAIYLLYGVVDYVPTDSEQQDLLQAIHQLAMKHIEALKRTRQWAGLEVFCRELLALENTYPPYYLEYALVLIQLKEYDHAQTHLDPLLQNPQFAEQAEQLIARLDLLRTGAVVLALQRQGDHYLVTVSVGRGEYLQLLLDTGASYSALNASVLDRFNAQDYRDLQRPLTLSTANGTVQSRLLQLERVALGGYQLTQVEFAALTSEIDGADGLLGMNVLRHFQFEIDQRNAELILQPHKL